MTSKEDWEELALAATPFEAQWYVDALRALGIQAVALGGDPQEVSALPPGFAPRDGGVRLMVPPDQLEQARDALTEIEQSAPTLESALFAPTNADGPGGGEGEPQAERSASVKCPDCEKEMDAGWVQVEGGEGGGSLVWGPAAPVMGWFNWKPLRDSITIVDGGWRPTRQAFHCQDCGNLLVRSDVEPRREE